MFVQVRAGTRYWLRPPTLTIHDVTRTRWRRSYSGYFGLFLYSGRQWWRGGHLYLWQCVRHNRHQLQKAEDLHEVGLGWMDCDLCPQLWLDGWTNAGNSFLLAFGVFSALRVSWLHYTGSCWKLRVVWCVHVKQKTRHSDVRPAGSMWRCAAWSPRPHLVNKVDIEKPYCSRAERLAGARSLLRSLHLGHFSFRVKADVRPPGRDFLIYCLLLSPDGQQQLVLVSVKVWTICNFL